jgi:putative hydroxymethylpyrimidine transport system permease protein
MTKTLHALGSAILAIVVWQAIVSGFSLPKFILPGPLLVAETMWKSRVIIFENALVTISEVLIGLVLGAMLGAATAINLATSSFARIYVRPILVFSQAVPVFALAPILTLWLGYGIWSKIFMTVLIIYFPVASAFYDGLTRTPKAYVDLAKVMGANNIRLMWHVRIPAALPSLGSGLRLAAVYAPIGAVIGEWVGASKGLGYLMLLANGRAKIDLMFAALFVLATFTVLLHAVVDKGAKRMIKH